MKWIAVMLLAVSAFSCVYHKMKDFAVKEDCTLIVPDSSKFKSHVLPILVSNCTNYGCHSGNDPAGKLNLEQSVAFSQITSINKGYLDTLRPIKSVLYNSLTSPGKLMPPTGKLSDCQIEIIMKWMAQKAKNN